MKNMMNDTHDVTSLDSHTGVLSDGSHMIETECWSGTDKTVSNYTKRIAIQNRQ